MSPAYKSLVKEYYEKKKSENTLPSGLKYPSPANLRDECLAAFKKEILKKDRKVLIDYFGENGNDEAVFKKIKKYDIAGFRPIQTFLKKKDHNLDEIKVELLAWLIDFEPRPYDYRRKYILDESETGDTPLEKLEDVREEASEEEPIVETAKPKPDGEIPPKGPTVIIIGQKDDSKQKTSSLATSFVPTKQNINPKIIAAAFLIFISATASIVYLKNKSEGCMYWAGDHYQPIPCSQKVGSDTVVIALDEERLNSLKRITREDTITYHSIGKVWYIKIDGRIEYYTASGNYPLDFNRKLKPLSGYIIDHHIDTAQ